MKNHRFALPLFICLTIITIAHLGSGFGLKAEEKKSFTIVTTIKPIQFLARALLKDVGEVKMLNSLAKDPHGGHLTTKEGRDLQSADLIIQVGKNFETNLNRTLPKIVGKEQLEKKLIVLSSLPGMRLLSFPKQDDHHHHHEGHHDEHDKDHKNHKEDNDEHEQHSDADHDKDEKTGTSNRDPHLWLDPDNAIYLANYLGKQLAQRDPERAVSYSENTDKLVKRLQKMKQTLKTKFIPLTRKPVFIIHNNIRYFTDYLGLGDPISLSTHDHDHHLSARAGDIRNMREKISKYKGKSCLFYNSNSSPKLPETIAEGLPVSTAKIDPLGLETKDYFDLISQLSNQFEACFKN